MLAVGIHRGKPQKPRLFEFGVMIGLLLFIGWLAVQFFWALDLDLHTELFILTVKYTFLVALIYLCIETVHHLRIFLWTHTAGCFYLGIIVFTKYIGGRFEGFASPGVSEANVGALLIVTGIITTFVLFLSGRLFEKAVAIGFMPFTLNALVATISRSGFLALGIAGIIFNVFAPKKNIRVVRIFSITGLALLLLLANPVFWDRIGTILFAGEEIEGVDTGSSRLVLAQAQFEMFSDHPLGCGHRCTAVLSPAFLDDRYLTGPEGNRARSSHNTFMTLLVEQGVPGAIFYVLLLAWIVRTSLQLKETMRSTIGLVPYTYTAVVAILGAITVGDFFVDYLKFEARLWFVALLMVLVKFDAQDKLQESHHSVSRSQ
jgi:O-antigen ligase